MKLYDILFRNGSNAMANIWSGRSINAQIRSFHADDSPLRAVNIRPSTPSEKLDDDERLALSLIECQDRQEKGITIDLSTGLRVKWAVS